MHTHPLFPFHMDEDEYEAMRELEKEMHEKDLEQWLQDRLEKNLAIDEWQRPSLEKLLRDLRD